MIDDRIQVPLDEERRIRDALIREALPPATRYACFWVNGEGRRFPGSTTEETSGYVLTDQDRVFSFWFGPDAATGRPALTRWRAEPFAAWWATESEYQRARAQVGLA